MADKKISELTLSATPLSGTEVLPVVQNGLTKQVSVANLTSGRSISCNGLTSTANISGTNINVGNTFWLGWGDYSARFTGSSGGALNVYTLSTLAASWDTSQNYHTKGNIVIDTAGKGIDFSANGNASGMTSELLDDYEEGTFNPTFTTDGVDFDSVTYDALTSAKYVKIGLMVHVQIMIRTDNITVGSATGNVRIGGLPFTASSGIQADSSGELTVGQTSSWAGDVPFSAEVVSGSTTARLWYRTSVNGATTAVAIADLGTGADTNLIRCSGSYIAA